MEASHNDTQYAQQVPDTQEMVEIVKAQKKTRNMMTAFQLPMFPHQELLQRHHLMWR